MNKSQRKAAEKLMRKPKSQKRQERAKALGVADDHGQLFGFAEAHTLAVRRLRAAKKLGKGADTSDDMKALAAGASARLRDMKRKGLA